MNYFIETALTPAKLFKMASNVKAFKLWLKETHNIDYSNDILKGHRFFLECAFTSIFHEFIGSESIALKQDRFLEMASGANTSIDKFPGKSDRALILKNLFRDYLELTTAESERSLIKSIEAINKKLVNSLINFYNENFVVQNREKISRKDLDKIILMDSLLIQFTQINNSGPYAHQGSLLHEYWISREKLAEAFEGYKYTMQFLYDTVLPKELYLSAELNNLHTADSWRTYVYNEQESSGDALIDSLNQTFTVNIQTCFESYFYRVNDMLEKEIPSRFNIYHTGPERLLKAIKKKLPKAIISHLIDSNVNKFDVEMSLKEKLDHNLQWYPVDVSNVLGANEFNGVSAFNTLLIGTLAVTTDDFVYVNKWKHPTDDPKRNDYSYAVLLNTSKTSQRSYAGWMLFFDCCNDFTGSRSDYLLIEKILKENKRKIKLTTTEITQEVFINYLKNYAPDKERIINNEILNLGAITKVKENKELFSKYQLARGKLLELLCYHAVTNHHHYESFTIKQWSRKLEGKEIDILLESKTQVRLIECKYDLGNFDLVKRIEDMDDVVRKRILTKQNDPKGLEIVYHKIDGALEFWFWLPPKEKDIEILKSKGIKYEVFGGGEQNKYYNNSIKYKDIKHIFELNFDLKTKT